MLLVALPPLSLKNKSMRKILITLFFVLPIFVNAQDVSGILFSGKSVDYFGQLTDEGNNKDGLGIQRLKGGNLFAGNLRKNKFHGFGMMIAGENGEITNCDGAYVYVGEWKYGVKNGKGIVYGRNGTAIYVGMFVDDTPTGKYPSEEIETAKHFSYIEMEEDDETNLFIGEVENGKPEGYGMTFYEDGFIGLCQHKDGKQSGVGIMIFPPNFWATFRVKDERYFQISSSNEQIERQTNNKTIATRERTELIQSLSKVLDAGVELAGVIGQIKDDDLSDNVTTPSIGVDVIGGSETDTHMLSSSNSNKYNLGEQQSYNTDKQTWSNYDGMLSAHFYGGRSATRNEVKQWQQKMKDLRAKWKAKGKDLPNSSNENKSTSNCSNVSHK